MLGRMDQHRRSRFRWSGGDSLAATGFQGTTTTEQYRPAPSTDESPIQPTTTTTITDNSAAAAAAVASVDLCCGEEDKGSWTSCWASGGVEHHRRRHRRRSSSSSSAARHHCQGWLGSGDETASAPQRHQRRRSIGQRCLVVSVALCAFVLLLVVQTVIVHTLVVSLAAAPGPREAVDHVVSRASARPSDERMMVSTHPAPSTTTTSATPRDKPLSRWCSLASVATGGGGVTARICTLRKLLGLLGSGGGSSGGGRGDGRNVTIESQTSAAPTPASAAEQPDQQQTAAATGETPLVVVETTSSIFLRHQEQSEEEPSTDQPTATPATTTNDSVPATEESDDRGADADRLLGITLTFSELWQHVQAMRQRQLAAEDAAAGTGGVYDGADDEDDMPDLVVERRHRRFYASGSLQPAPDKFNRSAADTKAVVENGTSVDRDEEMWLAAPYDDWVPTMTLDRTEQPGGSAVPGAAELDNGAAALDAEEAAAAALDTGVAGDRVRRRRAPQSTTTSLAEIYAPETVLILYDKYSRRNWSYVVLHDFWTQQRANAYKIVQPHEVARRVFVERGAARASSHSELRPQPRRGRHPASTTKTTTTRPVSSYTSSPGDGFRLPLPVVNPVLKIYWTLDVPSLTGLNVRFYTFVEGPRTTAQSRPRVLDVTRRLDTIAKLTFLRRLVEDAFTLWNIVLDGLVEFEYVDYDRRLLKTTTYFDKIIVVSGVHYRHVNEHTDQPERFTGQATLAHAAVNFLHLNLDFEDGLYVAPHWQRRKEHVVLEGVSTGSRVRVFELDPGALAARYGFRSLRAMHESVGAVLNRLRGNERSGFSRRTCFFCTLTHEIAHILGLGHCSHPHSLMYPFIGNEIAELRETDMRVARVLYRHLGAEIRNIRERFRVNMCQRSSAAAARNDAAASRARG